MVPGGTTRRVFYSLDLYGHVYLTSKGLFVPNIENCNIRISKSLCNGPNSYIIALLGYRNSMNELILKVGFRGQGEILS